MILKGDITRFRGDAGWNPARTTIRASASGCATFVALRLARAGQYQRVLRGCRRDRNDRLDRALGARLSGLPVMVAPGSAPRARPSRLKKGLFIATIIASGYGLVAYAVLPWVWTHYEHQRGLQGLPMVTRTAQGIPGDPLNVGLVGSGEDIVRAMHEAGWSPADPITWRTSLEIAGSVLLDRRYPDAPVSPLFYQGRRQDLAYEKEVGSSANRRHHVRFWKTLDSGSEGRPVWLGSVTFDRGSGLSRYTGQITHHIAPDLDAERDGLVDDLTGAGMVTTIYQVSGIGPTLNGRNGEGDPYYTDGEIRMAVLVAGGQKREQAPTELASPGLVSLKDAIWERGASSFRD